MSMNSLLKKMQSKGSESENKVNLGYVAIGVVILALVFTAGQWAAFYSPAEARAARDAAAESGAAEDATPEAVIREIVYTPTPHVVAIIETEYVTSIVEIPVIQTVEVQVPTYYEIPVEVTRLVEVPAPTATPTPILPAGVVRVCVYLEGVKGVWLDGRGIAGNSCTDVHSYSPVQDIKIEVHR
jgi:hypothetical protein